MHLNNVPGPEPSELLSCSAFFLVQVFVVYNECATYKSVALLLWNRLKIYSKNVILIKVCINEDYTENLR